MRAIFYDLETSDSELIGQILNYCFIFVNERLEPISESSGLVRISRLQLPSPGAILANKTDVVLHQQRAQDSERQALARIHKFLSDCVADAQMPIALIGFNSSKFDYSYLRTSWIRNGFDPFAWKDRLIERDVFLAVKKLVCSKPEFPFPVVTDKDGKKRRSLRLEALGHEFGLLSGAQAHEARADVLLTLHLCELLRDKFKTNCVTMDTYEGRPYERLARKPEVIWALEPNYDEVEGERTRRVPYTLLDVNRNYSLWVDLARYDAGKGRAAITAIKKAGASFFISPEQPHDEAWLKKAKLAQDEFKAMSLDTFWGKPYCDVEQHIFKLDFDVREALASAIHTGDSSDLTKLADKDGLALLIRYQLANYVKGSGDDAQMDERLKKYALRRYGGQVVLSKHEPTQDAPARMHPTLQELLDQMEGLATKCEASDKELMSKLREFYLNSDIVRVAGAQLIRHK
ncbi:MAG: hypothetical protein K1X79_11035 [Oligoflexia bacterium]|nr:hypothetical protein [Oligoflexia bacterium]